MELWTMVCDTDTIDISKMDNISLFSFWKTFDVSFKYIRHKTYLFLKRFNIFRICKEVRFIWDKVIRFEKYFLQVLFSQY